MIKANELRIGNFIYGVSDRVEIVVSVLSDMVITKAIKLGTAFNDDLANINGIQLNPKWLADFGADRRPDGYFINKLKFSYEINGLSEFVRFHYSGKVAYIKYVHQLQNLYFAITGQELTINP